MKIRESIPFVGDFKPEPKVGSFVVVGHGMLIIVSENDGKTWKQAFFATPGAANGPWATKAVVYGRRLRGAGWLWCGDALSGVG